MNNNNGFDPSELFERCKEVIQEHGLIFIEDVVIYAGCSKPTLYKHLPIGSDGLNELKELLEKNKIDVKIKLRKKWLESDNATLQLALMKLVATDDERKRLSTTHIQTEDVTPPQHTIKWNVSNKPSE